MAGDRWSRVPGRSGRARPTGASYESSSAARNGELPGSTPTFRYDSKNNGRWFGLLAERLALGAGHDHALASAYTQQRRPRT